MEKKQKEQGSQQLCYSNWATYYRKIDNQSKALMLHWIMKI